MTEQTTDQPAVQPTVQQAWAAVMADVQGLAKGQRVTAGPAKFNFRGVDDVMNALGPALRRHGVSVVPTGVTSQPENVTTAKGASMRNVTVFVTYAIHGPAGDSMPGAAAGEAADSGDKATPKAMSVAFRTFLLQALCLPTDEPDPDTHQYERADEAPRESPQQAVLRGLNNAQNGEQVAQVMAWAEQQQVAGEDAVQRALATATERVHQPAA